MLKPPRDLTLSANQYTHETSGTPGMIRRGANQSLIEQIDCGKVSSNEDLHRKSSRSF